MASKIDKKTNLLFEEKRVSETKRYSFDFVNLVESGDTIASVQSVTHQAAGNVAEVLALSANSPLATGTKVTAILGGGTHGEDYEITIKCTDSAGNTHEDDVLIKVRNAGNKV